MSSTYKPTAAGLRPTNDEAKLHTARTATGDPNPSKTVVEAASRGKAAAYRAHQAEKGKAG